MSIGDRRRRVLFQRATTTNSASGEPVKTYTNLCTSWASIGDLRGRERIEAEQVKSEVTTLIVTRDRSELSTLAPGDRCYWNGHTYDIKAVIPVRHRQDLEIMAVEHL